LEYTIAIAFTIGLASTLHCLGMCGGISGALTFSLPGEVRNSRMRLLPYVFAYGFGRIGSYAVAGALAGLLGAALLRGGGDIRFVHTLAQVIAAAVLVGIGLYLAGWFPRFAQLERIGIPWWRRLEPYGRRLLPVRSPLQAVLFGAVWGWLPCGLVYSILIWTLATGDPLRGALLMLAFGAGTLPGVMTAGVLAVWMVRLSRLPYLRQVIGLSIVAMGVGTLWYAGAFAALGV
jgi:uncharacterized protein